VNDPFNFSKQPSSGTDVNCNSFLDLQVSAVSDESLVGPGLGRLLKLGFATSDSRGYPLNTGESLAGLASTSLLLRQTFLPPKHYLLLTEKSLEFVYQLRPLDILVSILRVTPEL